MKSSDLNTLIALANSLITTLTQNQDDDVRYATLLQLIRIENILDTGRTLVAMTSDDIGENRQQINADLDRIRAEISSTIQGLDKQKIADLLRQAGESLKTGFIKAI